MRNLPIKSYTGLAGQSVDTRYGIASSAASNRTNVSGVPGSLKMKLQSSQARRPQAVSSNQRSSENTDLLQSMMKEGGEALETSHQMPQMNRDLFLQVSLIAIFQRYNFDILFLLFLQLTLNCISDRLLSVTAEGCLDPSGGAIDVEQQHQADDVEGGASAGRNGRGIRATSGPLP